MKGHFFVDNRRHESATTGDNVIELRKDISILNKSPKGLPRKAQGNALGKKYNNIFKL